MQTIDIGVFSDRLQYLHGLRKTGQLTKQERLELNAKEIMCSELLRQLDEMAKRYT